MLLVTDRIKPDWPARFSYGASVLTAASGLMLICHLLGVFWFLATLGIGITKWMVVLDLAAPFVTLAACWASLLTEQSRRVLVFNGAALIFYLLFWGLFYLAAEPNPAHLGGR